MDETTLNNASLNTMLKQTRIVFKPTIRTLDSAEQWKQEQTLELRNALLSVSSKPQTAEACQPVEGKRTLRNRQRREMVIR